LFMEAGSGKVATRSKVIKGTKWFEVDFETDYSWKRKEGLPVNARDDW